MKASIMRRSRSGKYKTEWKTSVCGRRQVSGGNCGCARKAGGKGRKGHAGIGRYAEGSASGRKAGADEPRDYAVYRFSRPEMIQNIMVFAGLDALIAVLFYRSVIAFLVLLPLVYPFLRMRSRKLQQERSRQMLSQFTTGMQLVNASLQAGYAIENAFREATAQLLKIYPEDSFIIREFRYMLTQMSLSVPAETLLTDLGERAHIEDIRDMAEVFRTAKRTGGDMIAIIRGAVTSIQAKKETQEEIETNLSGKASEQRILSIAPLGIIAYISVTSPGFLDVCYDTAAGTMIMTAALAVYAAAYLLGLKILRIEI